MNRICAALLVAVVVVVGVYGATNYNALLNSDSYTYLSYARSLARGGVFGDPGIYSHFRSYWPRERSSLISGNRHMDGGRIFYDIDVGYPLLLALAIRGFGLPAVFLVNPLLLLVLAVFLALLVRRTVGPGDPRAWPAALAGLLVFLLLPPGRVLLSSMKIMRDIPPLTALVVSYYLVVVFARSARRRWGVLLGASAAFGAAALIRYTFCIYAIPFCAYLGVSLAARREPWTRWLAAVLLLVVPALVLLSPVIVKDFARSGDLFDTAKALWSYVGASDSRGEVFSLDHLDESGAWYFDFLLRVYTPVGIFFVLAGLGFGIRRREVWSLFLPLLILHLGLFAIFRFKHSRYLLPVYCIFSGLGAWGCLELCRVLPSALGRIERRAFAVPLRLAAALAAAGAAVYFLAAGYSPALAALSLAVVPAVLIPYPSQVAPGILLAGLSVALLVQAVPPVFGGKRFTISDARRLGEAFDARTAPGSLVVCARYLKQNIDVYSHCVALNPNQISSPFGLTPAEAVRVLIRDGVEVYALDNKGKRKAARFVEQLRDYFDLRPVYRWRSADLNIDYPQFSEREFLTLFRVLPWSAVPVVLQPGPGTSGAAVFDARYPWWTGDRDYIRATADGAPLEGEVLDGYNYLKFPSAGSAVEFASDRGLPAFRILRGFEPDGSISLPFGSSSGIEDWKLLDDGFFREPGGKQWRTLSGKGAVRIPPFRGEGATVSLRVRPRGGAARLALALEGKPLETVDLGPGDWRELVVPVPPATAEVGAARLELEVLSDDGAPARLDLGAVRMTAGRGE